jgi:hypothetical protein
MNARLNDNRNAVTAFSPGVDAQRLLWVGRKMISNPNEGW